MLVGKLILLTLISCTLSYNICGAVVSEVPLVAEGVHLTF